jgi:hypothetical protein
VTVARRLLQCPAPRHRPHPVVRLAHDLALVDLGLNGRETVPTGDELGHDLNLDATHVVELEKPGLPVKPHSTHPTAILIAFT